MEVKDPKLMNFGYILGSIENKNLGKKSIQIYWIFLRTSTKPAFSASAQALDALYGSRSMLQSRCSPLPFPSKVKIGFPNTRDSDQSHNRSMGPSWSGLFTAYTARSRPSIKPRNNHPTPTRIRPHPLTRNRPIRSGLTKHARIRFWCACQCSTSRTSHSSCARACAIFDDIISQNFCI
jgi:hypothetical protein